MRKLLVLLLVFGLVIGCVGVVSAAMTISGSASPKVNETIRYSVSPVDNATEYVWSISPSLSPTTQSNSTSISYKFTEAKTYTLSVKAMNGTELNNGSQTITVTQVSPPVASFTALPQEGGAPLTVTFTSTSTNAASLLWDFGVSSASKPTTTSTTYTYETPGTYTVKLIAKNSADVANETIKTITVTQVPVTTIDVSPKTGVASLNVTFKATATNSPTSYLWKFGDGHSATTLNTNHTYTEPGTYNVSFTATNANGTSVARTDQITVTGNTSAYKVAIDATPVKGVAPLTVKFRLNTTIPTDEIRSEAEKGYEWDFGYDSDDDGTNEYSYSREPKDQTYSEDGTYTVKVTIRTKLGETYNAEIKISVSDLLAAFDASTTSGPAPLEVKFTDKSSGPISWKWSIYKTDGGSRTLQKELTNQNITYTFDHDGKYEVELAAIKGSKSVTTYKEIVVSAKATTAPTTKATTKATTAPTTAATTAPAVKAAALSADDSPVPNPMDVIEEFIRLLKVMLVPDNYNLAP